MTDRFKFRMWSTRAGRYFDETNDAMLENVFECMKQQICYDCQNPVFRKIYDRIAYNHIADGMVFEQCTGLKDKNGKLIYEGDIVEFDGDFHGDIAWDEDAGCWAIRTTENTIYTFDNLYGYELEIVGNIHENADLLGKDK